MKKIILRWIYRRFAAKFEDFLVEDYVKGIPEVVQHGMESVFDSQKAKFRRANDFLAFQLHQRMRNDPKNSERYQGMFVQLKLMDVMLKSRPDIKPVTPAQVEAKTEKFDYSKNIDEVLKTHKESNTQPSVESEDV